MRPTLTLLAALPGAALPGPAWAEPPRYDIGAHCVAATDPPDSLDSLAFLLCIESEAAARSGLPPFWERAPDHVRRRCDALASARAPGSYNKLGGCIRLELNGVRVGRKASGDRATVEQGVVGCP